jgi:hypothetical protein
MAASRARQDREKPMTTSDDRVPEDVETTASPTSPGPDSTDAGTRTSATAGTGQAVPDTGPGPAAADVDGDAHRD